MLQLDQPSWSFITLQDALQQEPLGNFEEKYLLLLGPGDYKRARGTQGYGGWGAIGVERGQGGHLDFMGSLFIGEFKI